MIDVHTHILPGMDDGSKNVEMSIAMLREEQKQGVDTVVLTPHFYARQNSPSEFLKRREASWNVLHAAWKEKTPRLLLGAEVQYFEGMNTVEDLPTLCIQGTDILLLEMPFSRWSDRMVRNVLELQDRFQITVLLAHLDRYEKYYTPQMLELLLRSGVLIQINCSAMTHFLNRRKVVSMIRRGEVHLLASDCHNMSTRAPTMGKFRKYAQGLEAEELFQV